MFFDGIAYALLAWYLEQVMPNEYGSHRPPWFLFTREYWTRTKPERAADDDGFGGGAYSELEGGADKDPAHVQAALEAREQEAHRAAGGPPSHIEPIRSSELRPRVFISHLHKVFHHGNSWYNCIVQCFSKKERERRKHRKGDDDVSSTDVVAVRDLNLTMYEGQITCLLGHNGAGKSTTISMLTGLYKPTRGSAYLHGYSIMHQMSSIRRHLGICPQHNVLIDTLTVKEHLELLAVLKGTPADMIDECVRDKIEEVGLQAKTNTYSSALSGGMKRKLSVGMALIGDSKVVFLSVRHARTNSFHACVRVTMTHCCV
jgi:ABC-type transport system involved in cytochrome c biogenesis ATPase subunit